MFTLLIVDQCDNFCAGPKTRVISKAPWEEDTIEEQAVSDSESPTDARSIFANRFIGKVRTRSRTLTQAKAEKERRFLGGTWGRASTDTRPSVDLHKRSMDSSVASYLQTPTSPRNPSFPDTARLAARTPSLFSTSSGTSSHSMPSGSHSGADKKATGAININAYSLDSREPSPAPGSPTALNFVHPYANLELLTSGHDEEALPSRSNSITTLTASTASSYVTPSSSSSSATSPGHDDYSSASKKEKRRPPQLAVSPLNRGPATGSIKSPSALSVSFVPHSPTLPMAPTASDDSIPTGMLGFPGSPAYNLISLEQAQLKARERSKSSAGSSQSPLSPNHPRELTTKKSKPTLAGVGGGFSSMIGSGSPSPHSPLDDGRARTVSAGSAFYGRPRGYTASSMANQSTTSVNIIQGGGIENIPESAGKSAAEPISSKSLKPKRSGIFKFFKDKGNSGYSSGNPNISAPSAPVHVAHNMVEPPPVPKLPAQFQAAKISSPPELDSRRENGLPPVVVSAPSRARSFDRAHSASDDSHTSQGGHRSDRSTPSRSNRSNTEPAKHPGNLGAQEASPFSGLRLRPMSSTFSGLPDDYLTSPKAGSGPSHSGSRRSSESRAGDGSVCDDPNVLSPVTPSFPPNSARSTFTHTSRASSGSDAFSSSIDPRTPSSLGFPPGVPRSSTDSQSAATIASLREQLEALRTSFKTQINELEGQVQGLKAELEASKCERCGQRSRRPVEVGIINRPRARTGTGCRTALGSSYD